MQDSSAFQFLAGDTIHESNTNPRRTFDEAKLYELAESIKHNGLIQPITVRPNNQGFEIVAGARRYRAAQLAELFSVPARIDLDREVEMATRVTDRVLQVLLRKHAGMFPQKRTPIVDATDDSPP
jgi:ParB/RepB/Spo0J family partition protein